MIKKFSEQFRSKTPEVSEQKPKSKPITGEWKPENLDIKKLPAVEVKNIVLFVNPEIETPLDLKEGESTKLGVFLTSNTKGDVEQLNLEIKEGHARSSILGRVVFRDKQGRLYRDIDLKGMGYITNDYKAGIVHGKERYNTNVPFTFTEAYGILKLGSAFHDKEMSEAFLEKGIRTHRIVAIISLEEIVVGLGHKISIEEARQQQFISEGIKPVIAIRAYGTKFRLDDVTGGFFFSKIGSRKGRSFKRCYGDSGAGVGQRPRRIFKKRISNLAGRNAWN